MSFVAAAITKGMVAGRTGLQSVSDAGRLTQMMFVTAYAEHAVQAFEAGAVDYIVKPVTAARLLQTVKRLKTRSAAPVPAGVWQQIAPVPVQHLKWIKASAGNTVRLVMVRDVLYFQSNDKYTRVVTHDGDALIRLPLKSLIGQLDPTQFAQIHRGAIVNLEAVERIDRDGTAMEIRLRGRPEKLAISEAYTRQFRQM